MAQSPYIDLQVSDQNNYIFPSVKPGDLLIKMTKEDAGFHVGSVASASNLLMSLKTSSVQFGGSNAAISMSNGQLLLPSGSVTAPTIAWSNDKQTGIYRPSSSSVAISSQGSNVATFSSNITFNKSIGIGKVPNATYDLDVEGTVNFASFLVNGQQLTANDPALSNVAFITSNIVYATSNVAYWAFDVANATSNVALASVFTTSNVAFTSSNAAYTAYNSAIAASNAGYAASNVAFTASNVAYSTNITLSNISQALSSIQPVNGYSANAVTVPTITMKYIPSSAKVTYGRVELGATSNVSLSNNGAMTVRVTHNLATTNYLVFPAPEDMRSIKVACSNYTANAFDLVIKNVSGVNIANPAVNYQLVEAATSNVTVILY